MASQLRIAVVGYGLVGQRHADVILKTPGLALAAVVDAGADARRRALALGVSVHASLPEMLDAARPDGVVLATPTLLHREQGLACLHAGCPVLIEKPIAATTDEAAALTDAARQTGVPLLVGHHRRHSGMVAAAHAAIAGGALGQVRAVQATCWFYKPDPYFEAAPWRTRRGAGPVSVNLVHDVDLLRHFCGEVTSVRAVAVPSRRGFENEDLASAILTFLGGAVATISVSDSVVSPWSWELTSRENPAFPATSESCYLIGGSEGALSVPDLRLWRHDPAPDWEAPLAPEPLSFEARDPLAAQMAHFARVIRAEEPPLVSGDEGLRSLAVVEAVDRAARTGEVQRLD